MFCGGREKLQSRVEPDPYNMWVEFVVGSRVASAGPESEILNLKNIFQPLEAELQWFYCVEQYSTND